MGRMRAGADPRAALTPPRRAFEFQAPKQAVCPASEAARKTGLRLDGIVVARSKATRRSRSRRGRPTFPWIASLRFPRNDARSNRLTPRPPALRLVLRAARSAASRRTLQKKRDGQRQLEHSSRPALPGAPQNEGGASGLRPRRPAHALFDRGQRLVRLRAVRPPGLLHVRAPAAAFAAERGGAEAHLFDGVEAAAEIRGDGDDDA